MQYVEPLPSFEIEELANFRRGPQRDNKKHFHILFSVSYGLSREELAVFNSSIRQAPYDRFEYPQMQCSESPFTYVGMSGPQDEYPVYDGAVRLPPLRLSAVRRYKLTCFLSSVHKLHV